MSGGTDARLVRMANQIAHEFGHQQPGNAVDATWDHIWHFWDPRMRSDILAYIDRGGTGLSEASLTAINKLRLPREPAPQTEATVFAPDAEGGGADGG